MQLIDSTLNAVHSIENAAISNVRAALSRDATARPAKAKAKSKRRLAPPLAVLVRRNVAAGPLTLVLHLNRKRLHAAAGPRKTITVYVHIGTTLPSRLLRAGYPIGSVQPVTLHTVVKAHRKR